MYHLTIMHFIKDEKSKKTFLYHVYRFLRNNKELDFRDTITVIRKKYAYCEKEKEYYKFFITNNRKKANEYMDTILFKFLKIRYSYFTSGNGNFKEFKFKENMKFKEFFELNKNTDLESYIMYN